MLNLKKKKLFECALVISFSLVEVIWGGAPVVGISRNELSQAINIAGVYRDTELIGMLNNLKCNESKGPLFKSDLEKPIHFFWMALIAAIEQDNVNVFKALVPKYLKLNDIKPYPMGCTYTPKSIIEFHASFGGASNIYAYLNPFQSRFVSAASNKAPHPSSGPVVSLQATAAPKTMNASTIALCPVFPLIENRTFLGLPKSKNTFFTQLFGFDEAAYNETRDRLCAKAYGDKNRNVQFVNVGFDGQQVVQAGKFECQSLNDLKVRIQDLPRGTGKVTIKNQVGESRAMHSSEPEGSVLQVAGQFNCLEFVNPHATPEKGIDCYIFDNSQGPACAIACAAGTAWRNYCVPMPPDGKPGQSSNNQINNLANIQSLLNTKFGTSYFTVQNGYTNGKERDLLQLSEKLKDLSLVQELKNALLIGVQWDTAVTDNIDWNHQKLVTQVYSSALSIGYSDCKNLEMWESFARLVLEASYEATLLVAIINNANRIRLGKPVRPVYLTKVGGGFFANEPGWIKDAIKRAVIAVHKLGFDLDVRVVHYGFIEDGYTDFGTGKDSVLASNLLNNLGGVSVVPQVSVSQASGMLEHPFSVSKLNPVVGSRVGSYQGAFYVIPPAASLVVPPVRSRPNTIKVGLTQFEKVRLLKIAHNSNDTVLKAAVSQLATNGVAKELDDSPDSTYYWIALVTAIEQDNLKAFQALVPTYINITDQKPYGRPVTPKEMAQYHGSFALLEYLANIQR